MIVWYYINIDKEVMALKVNYPNGQVFHPKKNNLSTKQTKKETTYSNRGMSLEEAINITNEQYLNSNLAVIHKKPTPIQVVKVDYPKRAAAKITEAYYRSSSTTDYNGVYKGRYIDFESKETKNKSSFPLNNFHLHQIEHMKKATKHGGICFAIILFSSINQLFIIDSSFLFNWWDQQFHKNGRKSIPLAAFKKDAHSLEFGFNPRIPYLEVIDKWLS